MAYRNGVYVAFNGCGTAVPTESDIKYYNMLKAWDENPDHNFMITNSHEKTYQVKDSSSKETLENRLMERMRNSTIMLLLVTKNSNENRGMLQWEIKKCVKTYNLPVIIVYTMYNLENWDNCGNFVYLPDILNDFILKDEVKTVSVPFVQKAILKAINTYSVHNRPKCTEDFLANDFYEKLKKEKNCNS